jgi:Protein of unknown function (DUF3352)
VRRLLLALLAALLALPLAACGGGNTTSGGEGGQGGEGGAAIVPASAPLLVRLDTTFDSPQWDVLNELLKKFPDGDQVFADLGGPGVDFEQDVKPALGPETDMFTLSGEDLSNEVFLAATQPRNQAKFDELLAKDEDKPVSEEIAGWQVVSEKRETIDRYKEARRRGSLADDASYKAAVKSLPAAALATIYVDGPTLARALSTQAKTGTGSGPVPGLGRIGWLAGAVTAEQRGFALDFRLQGDELEVTPFTPELPAEVPADVALFVDLKGFDQILEEVLRSPAVQKQLGQAQKALGGLIDEVIALFKGETAITARPAGDKTEYTLVSSVEDESKASATLDKLATLVGAFSQSAPEPVQIAGHAAQRLTYGKTTIYYAVFDGKVVVTNAEGGIAGLTEGPRLADSQAYQDAAEAAGLPDRVSGILYADVPKLLPLLDTLAKSSKDGKPLSPEARRNLEALSTAILYGSVDADVLTVKGFASVG